MIKSNIVLQLQKMINSNADLENNEIHISRQILKNLHYLQKGVTITDLAELCHTSNGSISRYSKDLGYENFSEFKSAIESYDIYLEELKYDLCIENYKEDNDLKIFTVDYTKNITESLESFLNSFNFDKIDYLCEIIHNKSKVIMYATQIPGNIIESLQHNLLSAGKFVEYYPITKEQIKSIHSLDKNSLALIFSLEGSLVSNREISLAIAASPAYSILITQNKSMKHADHFNEIISLGKHDVIRTGKFKLLLFVEILASAYLEKYN